MKKILIVEDETPLYEVIKKRLEFNGFETRVARSMDQAIEIIYGGEQIDLIWLDHLLLGPQSGLDVVEKIKADKKFSKIPIFLVSNSTNTREVEGYARFGIDRRYAKSDYSLDQIIADVKSFLNVA